MNIESKLVKNNFFSIHAIAIISFAQLFGTSLWFSANSVVLDLIREWNISVADIGWLTNALQIGFILGTFLLHLLELLTDSKQVQFLQSLACLGLSLISVLLGLLMV